MNNLNAHINSADALRWGDGSRANWDFAREKILDAAWRCYQNHVASKASMEDIAREAKVSRQTVYRYFQNGEEVRSGVLVRELYTLIDLVRVNVADTPDFTEFLVELLVSVSEKILRSPVFNVLLHEDGTVPSRTYINYDDIFTMRDGFIQLRFDLAKTAGELRDDIVFEQLMHWCAHLLAVYVQSLPPFRVAHNKWRQMLRLFLVSSIVREEVFDAKTA